MLSSVRLFALVSGIVSDVGTKCYYNFYNIICAKILKFTHEAAAAAYLKIYEMFCTLVGTLIVERSRISSGFFS